jgi:hypothetical protein
MFDEEEQLVNAARRWYAAVKKNRDPILTHKLALELAMRVLSYEKWRGLKHLKPRTAAERGAL